jgi:hypothetical protein
VRLKEQYVKNNQPWDITSQKSALNICKDHNKTVDFAGVIDTGEALK